MEIGESITFWAVHLSIICYFIGAALWSLARLHSNIEPIAGAIWTSGCLLCIGHVLTAFHFYHDWSHKAAFWNTAQQTKELLGFSWGRGIYLNYAFTLAWFIDTTWWWIKPESHQKRPQFFNVALHTFLLFIVFNATAVFGEGFIRVIGISGTFGLVILWWKVRDGRLKKPKFPARLFL